jgi:alkylated DNA repair dioxygenase AlkB
MSYPYQLFLPEIDEVIQLLSPVIGFECNNCLINYYLDGKAKMGYHADQTDILYPQTGIAIVSLGETRTLRFRNIANKELFMNYDLSAGSLIYMTQEIQDIWQHAIPPSQTGNGRISLTFRKIK